MYDFWKLFFFAYADGVARGVSDGVLPPEASSAWEV